VCVLSRVRASSKTCGVGAREMELTNLTNKTTTPRLTRNTSSGCGSSSAAARQRLHAGMAADEERISIDDFDRQGLLGDRSGDGSGNGSGVVRIVNGHRYSSPKSVFSTGKQHKQQNDDEQEWATYRARARVCGGGTQLVRGLTLLLLGILVWQVGVLIGKLDSAAQSQALRPHAPNTVTPRTDVTGTTTTADNQANSPDKTAMQNDNSGGGGAPSIPVAATPSQQELRDKQLTDMMSRYVHNASSTFLSAHWASASAATDPVLLLRVPTRLVLGGVTSIPSSNSTETTSTQQNFIIDAIYAKGSVLNGHRESLFHFPASDTDYNVFHLGLSPDGQSVDLLKSRLGIRSSASATDELVSDGVWPGWVTSLPVLGRKDNEYWLDATALVVNRFYIVDTPAGSDADPAVTAARVSSASAFPRNLNVGLQVRLGRGTHAVSLDYTFALSRLPESPMTPRVAHDRVGYFTTSFESLGFNPSLGRHLQQQQKESSSTDKSSSSTARAASGRQIDSDVYMINRRRLSVEPADGRRNTNSTNNDSSWSTSLVYYIDPSVPARWRLALKRGVEAWQQAFEAAGFTDNAIRAVLPGDSDWPDDYDAGDMRYSTISWAVSENEVMALGPATVDPRSGEILNSDIVFTQGWVRNWMRVLEEKGYAGRSSSQQRGYGAGGDSRSLRGSSGLRMMRGSANRMMRGGSCLHGHHHDAHAEANNEGSFGAGGGAASDSLEVGKLWWKLVGGGSGGGGGSGEGAPKGQEHTSSRRRLADEASEGVQQEAGASSSSSGSGRGSTSGMEEEEEECVDWEQSAFDEVIAAGLTSVTMHEVCTYVRALSYPFILFKATC
jgi:hypothetical protein